MPRGEQHKKIRQSIWAVFFVGTRGNECQRWEAAPLNRFAIYGNALPRRTAFAYGAATPADTAK